jgi:hemoglobin/transferrin/lactoferrin receptor protein
MLSWKKSGHGFRHGIMAGVLWLALMAGGLFSPAHAQSAVELDPVTVLATKTPEPTTESLAGVSSVRQEQMNELMPGKISDLLFGIPSVTFVERGDDPATAINIRGMQDFGRVAVIIDGARQDFQRSGHNANGMFYLEPELLSGVDVVRGPVANIYGSGAIGGVASFTTKDVNDVLKGNETWGMLTHGLGATNGPEGLSSVFAAARPNQNVDLFAGGTYRKSGNYKDGDGNTVPNTGQDIWTGIGKITVRLADGHEIKLSGIHYDGQYASGQPGVAGVYDNHLVNDQFTAKYTFSRPDIPLIDFVGSAYWNKTSADQTVTQNFTSGGIDFTGPVGTRRNFTVQTSGFDVNNTGRFDLGPFRNAITVGGDGFRDDVTVSSTGDPGSALTPGGNRSVSGAFAQWKVNYSTWLETIAAVRYDNYSLSGGGTENSGSHVSPKFTVGVTPFAGFTPYATYAEGYRAPAVTETLIDGYHPGDLFYFIPNPNLKPEVGKTLEGGLNLKYDNIFMAGDKFRGKIGIFRNNVDDYIDLVGTTDFVPPLMCPPSSIFGGAGSLCYQYVNVAHARIDGFEFESMYDAGGWFFGLSGQHLKGRNADTGAPLATIQPDQLATTVGARFLDRKLTVAMRWLAVAAKHAGDIPVDDQGDLVFPASAAYNLVKLYVGYEPTQDVMIGFSVDNLLNQEYTPYMNGIPERGITFKGELKVRFTDSYFKQKG